MSRDYNFTVAEASVEYLTERLMYSGPCNSFNCLGHFKNVYDDDDGSVISLPALGNADGVGNPSRRCF